MRGVRTARGEKSIDTMQRLTSNIAGLIDDEAFEPKSKSRPKLILHKCYRGRHAAEVLKDWSLTIIAVSTRSISSAVF